MVDGEWRIRLQWRNGGWRIADTLEPARRLVRQPKRFREEEQPAAQPKLSKRPAAATAVDGAEQPVSNPFRQAKAWHTVGLSPRACTILQEVWDARIAAGSDRPFQSKLSQDQQQRLMCLLVPGAARMLRLNEQTHQELVSSLRSVAKDERPRRLSLEDKAELRDSKPSLWWAEGTDLVERATGELPVAIKLYVDATGCGSLKQLENVSGIDPDKLRVLPLDSRERALFKAAAASSQLDGGGSLLVLIFILFSAGKCNWRTKNYFTSHVTRIEFGPGGTALYTDHGMSAQERQDFEQRSAFVDERQRSRPVYSEPTSLPTAVKARPRPQWACPGVPGVKQYHYCNLWPVGVFRSLQAELQKCAGVELQHSDRFALQSWDESQCAIAMLFDLHIGIANEHLTAVVGAFAQHPANKRQKRRLAEDKSANSTMLRLYEAWLASRFSPQFALSKEWTRTNSLNVGDLQSCGVCDVCDQKDTPSCIILCAHEHCGRAVHCFCLEPPLAEPEDYPGDWYCDTHKLIKSLE